MNVRNFNFLQLCFLLTMTFFSRKMICYSHFVHGRYTFLSVHLYVGSMLYVGTGEGEGGEEREEVTMEHKGLLVQRIQAAFAIQSVYICWYSTYMSNRII